MKRIKQLWVSLFLILMTAASSDAVPIIQLDISDSTYNPAAGQSGYNNRYDPETILSSDTKFTLYALLSNPKKTNYLEKEFVISAALWPKGDHDDLESAGSFKFNGQEISLSDMHYGTPSQIARHGVFDTYYTEFKFYFDKSRTVGSYDSQLNPGGFGDFQGKDLFYTAFDVDIGNLKYGYDIHFDLYCMDGKIFAPFSHDAQSDPPPSVPEPDTWLLLGLGLAGLAWLRRRGREL